MKSFKGYHGEWNLGSPGGWEYQRMIQEMYLPAWEEIRSMSGIDLDLDLENELFKPSLGFSDLLMDAHLKKSAGKEPFIAIIAEEDTLEDVVENIRFITLLKERHGVDAVLAGPRELSMKGGKIILGGREVSILFMDFNVSVLVALEKAHSITPILSAIEQGIMVNPKGMEAINTKSIFEAVGSDTAFGLSRTTIERTPWTRRFYPRTTTGPNGEEISDLVAWARDNWNRIVLKPEFGWSGKGIIICPFEPDSKIGIKKALEDKTYGGYIIQEFIPGELWSEDMPEIEAEKHIVALRRRQTDFRTLVTNLGLIGFLGRYGGYPTNVGSGGGVQALAIIRSEHTVGEAVKILNQAILDLGFNNAKAVRDRIDARANSARFTYINGPIPIALRPRLVTPKQVEELREYGENLYRDTLYLEGLWRQGRLKGIVELDKREEEIIRMQPRSNDTPAMIASDGLFDFGAGL